MDKNLPVNKRPDYIEHLKKLKDCHEYLVGHLGYSQTLNKWVSYEYTTVFKKDNIEVTVIYETSVPSSISVTNTDLPYDESKGLTNVVYLTEFCPSTFEHVKNRLKELEKNKTTTPQQNLYAMLPDVYAESSVLATRQSFALLASFSFLLKELVSLRLTFCSINLKPKPSFG